MDSSPQERYLYDSRYHAVVDTIKSHLHACTFSPEEMREMVLLACLQHQIERARTIGEKCYLPVEAYPSHVLKTMDTLVKAIDTLIKWTSKK